MLNIYKPMQYFAFIFFIMFAFMRLFNKDFVLLISINTFSLFFAVTILLYSSLLKTRKETNGELSIKQQHKIGIIYLIFIFIGIITLPIIYLLYANHISTEFGDFFAIVALALSMSNDLFSDLILYWICKPDNKNHNIPPNFQNM